MDTPFNPTSTGAASYAPEDDKIRLYVGRVPREEYDFLRSQGWTATPKQSCDFVATWTPEREATALAYSEGVLEDEDQSPQERAADRAERFTGYREKRRDEAFNMPTARLQRLAPPPELLQARMRIRTEGKGVYLAAVGQDGACGARGPLCGFRRGGPECGNHRRRIRSTPCAARVYCQGNGGSIAMTDYKAIADTAWRETR